jgi:membrane protease YdiL (CAAX protease family)
LGSLLKFFLVTYTVSWVCFCSAAIIPEGTTLALLRVPLLLLGTFAPSLVAIGLTTWDNGTRGTQAFLGRLFKRRNVDVRKVNVRWYLFAIGYMAAIKLAVALVHRAITGAWPTFGDTAWYVTAVAIVFSTPVQAGEEIGWRGYALPRLAARMGYARASLLLGVLWACWHLPLFFVPGLDMQGQSFPVWALSVTALSVAITWLYAHTEGSLLLVMLMHSAVNQTLGIVPSAVANAANPFALSHSLVAWITAALLWTAAAYFLIRMPRTKPQSAASQNSPGVCDVSGVA